LGANSNSAAAASKAVASRSRVSTEGFSTPRPVRPNPEIEEVEGIVNGRARTGPTREKSPAKKKQAGKRKAVTRRPAAAKKGEFSNVTTSYAGKRVARTTW